MLRPIPVPPPVTSATFPANKSGRKQLCQLLLLLISLFTGSGGGFAVLDADAAIVLVVQR